LDGSTQAPERERERGATRKRSKIPIRSRAVRTTFAERRKDYTKQARRGNTIRWKRRSPAGVGQKARGGIAHRRETMHKVVRKGLIFSAESEDAEKARERRAEEANKCLPRRRVALHQLSQ
jgi:hypothetical protein